MVDDTKSGILKHKANEGAYRRLQQGFEALRPAFLYNYRGDDKLFCRGRETRWGKVIPAPVRVQSCPVYFTSILISFGFASSFLGRTISRIPLVKVAFAFSLSTSTGRATVLAKLPKVRSQE